ncbi:VOC family protein [Streptomyces sp. R28]|uniref:VOC family protein n=1 Tax=Streptomyces sp. R28 TaxID=3238628 RepID=A0AB39PWI3_9ACTN
MTIRRIVPDVHVGSQAAMQTNRDFYGLLGFEEVMHMGWVMTMASPANPTAQISFFTEERTAPVVPDLSVEVEDVDAVYAQVTASGAEVVRELRDEEWGVRRFFVRDPNGRVVNVLTHQRAGEMSVRGDGGDQP